MNIPFPIAWIIAEYASIMHTPIKLVKFKTVYNHTVLDEQENEQCGRFFEGPPKGYICISLNGIWIVPPEYIKDVIEQRE